MQNFHIMKTKRNPSFFIEYNNKEVFFMKTKIDYKNDFAFRYILGSNTPDSIYLLTILIEGALNIKLKELHILNPELIPSQLDDKDMILDLRVKTDQNKEIDIEM